MHTHGYNSATGPDMTPGGSKNTGNTLVTGGSAGHSYCHGTNKFQHVPQSSAWPWVVAQDPGICVSLDGDTGHGHQHRTWMMEGLRPRHGFGSSSGPDHTMSLGDKQASYKGLFFTAFDPSLSLQDMNLSLLLSPSYIPPYICSPK